MQETILYHISELINLFITLQGFITVHNHDGVVTTLIAINTHLDILIDLAEQSGNVSLHYVSVKLSHMTCLIHWHVVERAPFGYEHSYFAMITRIIDILNNMGSGLVNGTDPGWNRVSAPTTGSRTLALLGTAAAACLAIYNHTVTVDAAAMARMTW